MRPSTLERTLSLRLIVPKHLCSSGEGQPADGEGLLQPLPQTRCLRVGPFRPLCLRRQPGSCVAAIPLTRPAKEAKGNVGRVRHSDRGRAWVRPARLVM